MQGDGINYMLFICTDISISVMMNGTVELAKCMFMNNYYQLTISCIKMITCRFICSVC